jgi:hypothetical protein
VHARTHVDVPASDCELSRELRDTGVNARARAYMCTCSVGIQIVVGVYFHLSDD